MKTLCRISAILGALAAVLFVQSGLAEGAYFTDLVTSTPGTNWSGTGVTALWSANSNGSNAPLSTPAADNTYTTVWNGLSFPVGGFTSLRNPYSAGAPQTVVFPGDSLILNFNTRLVLDDTGSSGTNQGGLAGTTGAAVLAVSYPILSFPGVPASNYAGLVLNGGVLDPGANFAMEITGTIEAAPGSTSYLTPGGNEFTGAPAARSIVFGGQMSGSGTVVLVGGANTCPSAQVTGTANSSFTGTWVVQGGWLQGVGDGTQDGYNSLGTNGNCALIVNPNYVLPTSPTNGGALVSNLFNPTNISLTTNISLLDLGSNIMNSAGSLTILNNGKMWLHGHYIFSSVTLESTSLTANGGPSGNGYYPYSYLTSTFPSNFTGLPAIFTTLGGDITVQPYGAIPGYAAAISLQPSSVTNFVGDNAQFISGASGVQPLTLQWWTVDNTLTNFTGMVSGANISGATNATLTISNVNAASVTNFALIASNSLGMATSGVVSLTVYADPASITLNYSTSGGGPVLMAGGLDWNSPGYWWDGNTDGGLPAVVLAAELPGAPFVVPAGSFLRTPSGAASATFPGGELDLDGSGNFDNNNNNLTNNNSILAAKGGPEATAASTSELYFTNLVMNGGQFDNGGAGVVVVDGGMTIGANNGYIYNASTDDRGFQINSALSGSGTIKVYLYSSQTVFEPAYSNDVDVTGTSNPFNGAWLVTQGPLLGKGDNSLGTNNITVGANGALETMYDISNPNGTLALIPGSRVYLHQNDTFGNVTVDGVYLAAGTYSYATLAAAYGTNYFPASWNQLYGSTVSNASGQITVVSTNGNAPNIGVQPQSQALYAGRTAIFSVLAGGEPTLYYQWETASSSGGPPYTNLSDVAGQIVGSSTAALTLLNISNSDTLDYYVMVSNSVSTLLSSPATLTVITPSCTYESDILGLTSSNLVAYWRLDEMIDPSTGTGAGSVIAYDYWGGFDGIYGVNTQNGANGVAGPELASGYPGSGSANTALAPEPGNVNSWVTVPALNVNTNTVTIVAWIYPTTPEPTAAAVFYCRAGTTSSGMNYVTNPATGSNTLGYTWNGNPSTYSWPSGIVPPQNQWSMAALVVTPANATVYLVNATGLQSSVNNITNAVQNFDGVSLIASDGGYPAGTRTFFGTIDEVSFFNTNLSAGQISALYDEAAGNSLLTPEIVTQPESETNFAGQTAEFTVVATGTNLAYQWQVGPLSGSGPCTNLSDAGQISGSSTATLSITDINSASNTFAYDVVITNSFSPSPTSSVPATLTVVPAPTSITLNYTGSGSGSEIMGYGQYWDTPGFWWDGQQDGGPTATALAPLKVPFAVPPGSVMRTAVEQSSTFPGLELDVDGDGNFNYGNITGLTTTGAIVTKQNVNANKIGVVYFTNLVINGGQVDQGSDSALSDIVVINGAITIGVSNAFFYEDTNGSDGRGFVINSVLSGTGTVQEWLYSLQSGYQTAYTNNLEIAGANNPFLGTWLVTQGALLGSGINSLGTNNITVAANGALETLYNINDPNATLTLDGMLFLHQNDTFQYVTVNGDSLYAGTYTAAQLSAALPANFPATWTQLNDSAFSTASGTLTVLQPPPPQPTLGFTLSPFTLTWSNGTLMQATNLLGPWVPNANPSPYVVTPSNAQMYFRVEGPVLP